MLPTDPGAFAKRKRRGDGQQRGHGTLPMQPDLSGKEKQRAVLENLARVQSQRPLKPPMRQR